jgi:predicted CoA-substrate-specific enzyme activase
MRSAGIDIGSRTVKLVALEDGKVVAARKADNSFDPVAVGTTLLEGVGYDRLTATGYGRHIFRRHYECGIVSEIKAFASGARHLFPACRAILDIGGQDTKVSYLGPDGRVLKFEMNDKCAAGTGRFLEIMAGAMNYRIEEFGRAALRSDGAAKISAMCTVFAESEVISLLNGGAKRDDVALGIHEAITRRVASMLGRLPAFEGLVFSGGVARNPCIRRLLEKNLGVPVDVPEDPELVGALGAALENVES